MQWTHARRETGAWPFASAARARPVSCAQRGAVDRVSALDTSGAGVALAEFRVDVASAWVTVSVIDDHEWGACSKRRDEKASWATVGAFSVFVVGVRCNVRVEACSVRWNVLLHGGGMGGGGGWAWNGGRYR